MRKFVLIAAMILLSATAQAGTGRGLTLASNDDVPAAEQPKSAAPVAAPAETPKYVDRPAAVDTTAPAPKGDEAKPVADRESRTKTARSKRHHGLTEARVIYELHRHGIYW